MLSAFLDDGSKDQEGDFQLPPPLVGDPSAVNLTVYLFGTAKFLNL
jgi:hypothetical protein